MVHIGTALSEPYDMIFRSTGIIPDSKSGRTNRFGCYGQLYRKQKNQNIYE